MNIRTSFIIPARNENPAVVAATIDGLRATTYSGWREIIVVDDASIVPLKIGGPDITLIRNDEPQGVTQCRRLGTKQASGHVFVWIDAHMTFGHGWLEAMLAEIDSGALLCTPWRNYDRTEAHAWGADHLWCQERDYPNCARPGFDFSHRRRRPRGRAAPVPQVIGACYAMRRDAYERAGGFCPLFRVYGMDEQDLSARAWLTGGSVRCVTRADVGHLDRTRFPYPVSYDHIEFNQLVMIRSLFDQETATALEEFFEPLPETVARWLGETDIDGWRSEVRPRRRMSDREFFRRVAPRVPLSFGRGVKLRRGHLPASRIRAHLAAEEQRYGYTDADEVSSPTLPPQAFPTQRLIHGAALEFRGRAIVLVGPRETGRRALVSELVRAGATLYSSTFIVLDDSGRVHPSAGADVNAGRQPLKVALVAAGRSLPGHRWSLSAIPPALAALILLEQAIGSRDQTIFQAVNRAVEASVAFTFRRGPAGPVARALLQRTDGRAD